MKKLTLIGSAVVLAGGWQLAQAQAPGGGGFAQMTFDALNTETEDSPDHLTQEEVTAFMQQRMANFGGRGGGPRGGGQGGAAGGGGGPGGPGGPNAGGPGGGPAMMFSQWDTNGDGRVTREEFDARPRGFGRSGGPGGPGGPGRQGGAGGQGGANQDSDSDE